MLIRLTLLVHYAALQNGMGEKTAARESDKQPFCPDASDGTPLPADAAPTLSRSRSSSSSHTNNNNDAQPTFADAPVSPARSTSDLSTGSRLSPHRVPGSSCTNNNSNNRCNSSAACVPHPTTDEAADDEDADDVPMNQSKMFPSSGSRRTTTHSQLENSPSRVNGDVGSSGNGSNSMFRFHADLRKWKFRHSDRLNALIDECERQVQGRKLYVCKFCGKVYEIKSSMRYHMKIIHLQMHLRTTEMQCRICGKQFTCVSAVNRHQSKCILANSAESTINHSESNLPYSPANNFNPKLSIRFDSHQNSLNTSATSMGFFNSSNNCETNASATSLLSNNSAQSLNRLCDPLTIGNLNREYLTEGVMHYTPQPQLLGPPDGVENAGGEIDPHGFSRYSTVPLTNNQLNRTFPPCGFQGWPIKNNLPQQQTPLPLEGMNCSWPNPLMWPGFQNLQPPNMSDLNPLHLEMCMKAVARSMNPVKDEDGQFSQERMKYEDSTTVSHGNPLNQPVSPSNADATVEPPEAVMSDEIAIDLSSSCRTNLDDNPVVDCV